MTKQTIDDQLLFAQNAIANALSEPTIGVALATFGYDEARITEGLVRYTKTYELHLKQAKEYGEQFTATDELSAAKTKANHTYMIQLKIARIALRGNRGAAETLQLSGRRKESLSHWLKQARVFYNNALNTSEYLAALAKFGITKEKLESNQGLIQETESKYNTQLKEKGEAQMATEARDQSLDLLQDWMTDFIAVARIALDDQSQYLEMLGITVASGSSHAFADEEEEAMSEG